MHGNIIGTAVRTVLCTAIYVHNHTSSSSGELATVISTGLGLCVRVLCMRFYCQFVYSLFIVFFVYFLFGFCDL